MSAVVAIVLMLFGMLLSLAAGVGVGQKSKEKGIILFVVLMAAVLHGIALWVIA